MSPDLWPWAAGGLGAALAGLALAAAVHVHRLRARERAARAAADAAARLMQRSLDGIADGFLLLDPAWRLTYANRAARTLLGRTHEALIGQEARAVFPPADFADFYRKYRELAHEHGSTRFEARTADGTWVEVHVSASPEGASMHFRDVTERRRHEEKLRGMTLVDELTGLYNRRGFFALAEQQRRLAIRKGRSLFLVFADLDDLKRINDTFGHTAGDQALFEAAAVLRGTFRETDVVARIGGDEFAALVLESDPDVAPQVVRRLEANVERTNQEGSLPFALSFSVGVASFDASAATPIDELLSLADHRMYEHKRARRRKAATGDDEAGEAAAGG